MGDYVTCRRCGRIHLRGQCTKPKYNYGNRYKADSKANTFRSTRQWREKSKSIRERSNYMCAVCLDKGIVNYKDLEVHHIIKINNNYDLRLEDSNLVCLCSGCHKLADAGELSIDYLSKLAYARDWEHNPPTLKGV